MSDTTSTTSSRKPAPRFTTKDGKELLAGEQTTLYCIHRDGCIASLTGLVNPQGEVWHSSAGPWNAIDECYASAAACIVAELAELQRRSAALLVLLEKATRAK